MIANNEEMKMEESHLVSIYTTDILTTFLPLPNFLETFFSPLKKEVRGDRKNNVILSKNLKNFVCSCLSILMFFNVFTATNHKKEYNTE